VWACAAAVPGMEAGGGAAGARMVPFALLKCWQQEKRPQGRIDDGRKTWKLFKMDLKSFTRRDDYTQARDDMFKAADTAWAPWFVVRSDDKRRARLSPIEHRLASIPHKTVPRAKVRLYERHIAGADQEPRLPLTFIADLTEEREIGGLDT
jgi:polyphosphate kinase